MRQRTCSLNANSGIPTYTLRAQYTSAALKGSGLCREIQQSPVTTAVLPVRSTPLRASIAVDRDPSIGAIFHCPTRLPVKCSDTKADTEWMLTLTHVLASCRSTVTQNGEIVVRHCGIEAKSEAPRTATLAT